MNRCVGGTGIGLVKMVHPGRDTGDYTLGLQCSQTPEDPIHWEDGTPDDLWTRTLGHQDSSEKTGRGRRGSPAPSPGEDPVPQPPPYSTQPLLLHRGVTSTEGGPDLEEHETLTVLLVSTKSISEPGPGTPSYCRLLSPRRTVSVLLSTVSTRRCVR